MTAKTRSGIRSSVRTKLGWLFAGALWGASALLSAQETAPAQPPVQAAPNLSSGYLVTGRVVCGDTQRPARFTQVTLLPARQGGGGEDFGGRSRRASARTDLDGNFAIPDVPAGDYYVTGSLTGYVNPANALQAALSAGTDPAAAAPGVPLVHVAAGGGSAAVILQRGGVIGGTVQWDDGSPAAGVQVLAQPAPPQGISATGTGPGPAPGGFGPGNGVAGSAQTDDRGRYRIPGLAPGSYLVRASVQVPVPIRGEERAFARTFNLLVYAPDKMRRTDAAAVTVAATEEHGEVGIVIGLAGLHSISGTVSSTGAAVRSGTVNLTDQTDATLNRAGFLAADGSFVVVDVPPGNYSLTVNASAQPPGAGSRGGPSAAAGNAVRFQPLQETVTVADGDVTGLSLNVTVATGVQ